MSRTDCRTDCHRTVFSSPSSTIRTDSTLTTRTVCIGSKRIVSQTAIERHFRANRLPLRFPPLLTTTNISTCSRYTNRMRPFVAVTVPTCDTRRSQLPHPLLKDLKCFLARATRTAIGASCSSPTVIQI